MVRFDDYIREFNIWSPHNLGLTVWMGYICGYLICALILDIWDECGLQVWVGSGGPVD